MKKLTALILALVNFALQAATFTSNSSTFGDWDIGGNPGASDDIVMNHDWSGNDMGTLGSWRANFAGTITVNSGGYFEVTQAMTTFNGTITVNSGGTFKSSSSTAFSGGSVTVNGYMELGGSATADITIGGTGTVNSVALGGSGGFGGGLTLPVELSQFKASSLVGGILLEWTTLSEVNNNYFEIQRSYDGVAFETIGQVFGVGNSVDENNYSFVDYNSKGKAYYRLKQVDLDGTFEYSHVVIVGGNTKALEIVQNGISKEFFLLTESEDEVQVGIYDITGKQIFEEVLQGAKGGRFNFELESKGLFIVNATVGSYQVSKKLLIK